MPPEEDARAIPRLALRHEQSLSHDLERLQLLAQRQVAPAKDPLPDLHVGNREQAAEGWVPALTRRWRLAGLAVQLDLSGPAFGKQFKRAAEGWCC
jgi:hypothetical protein